MTWSTLATTLHKGNGWDNTHVDQKRDEDPTKVYKGFWLQPAQVQGRKSAFNVDNNGSPCFRIRPRYNSEYMWNKTNLDALKPILDGQELTSAQSCGSAILVTCPLQDDVLLIDLKIQ